VPVARKVILDPTDSTRGWILWGSGYIQPFGGAPTPAFTIPTTWADANAQDFQIIDPIEPSGYVLSWTGNVLKFGGVTAATNYQDTGAFHTFRKFYMNPAGNGQGYEVDYRGVAYWLGPTNPGVIGGSVPLSGQISGGVDWGEDILADFVMYWPTKRWAMLNGHGVLYSPNFGFILDAGDPRPHYDTDVYRALAFSDPTLAGTPGGWLMSMGGRVYMFNAANGFIKDIPWPDSDTGKDLVVISNGLSGTPLTMLRLGRAGQQQRDTASNPPTAVITTPTSFTTTTRPHYSWIYIDPNGDAQDRAEVYIFLAGTFSGGTVPDGGGHFDHYVVSDRRTFMVDSTVDVPNGTHRMYLRVTDASGQQSSWYNLNFTMSVTAPSAPTIAVVRDSTTYDQVVTVTKVGTPPAGHRVEVQYSDDAGVTWEPVRGSGTIGFSGTTAVFRDNEAPYGVRAYRTRTVVPDPYLAGTWSSSVNATMTGDRWVLSSPESGDTVVVRAQPDFKPSRPTGTAWYESRDRSQGIAVYSENLGPYRFSLTLWALDRATYDGVQALLAPPRTLLLRDPFGRAWYLAVTDDVDEEFIRSVANPDETTELGFRHSIPLQLREVVRPDYTIVPS
jgi:hypothetical protein